MDPFDAMLYKAPSQEFLEYSKQSMASMYNTVSDSVKGFIKDTGDYFHNKYTSKAAIDKLKNVHISAGQNTNLDTIVYLNDPIYAKPVMQEYIMSNPRYYDMYKNKHINGFNETIIIEDRLEPEENDLYLKVMDGWVLPDGRNNYPIEYIDGYEALNIDEQIAIIDTWSACEAMLAEGLDPTEGTRE